MIRIDAKMPCGISLTMDELNPTSFRLNIKTIEEAVMIHMIECKLCQAYGNVGGAVGEYRRLVENNGH